MTIEVGARIRQIRLEQGLTLEMLAAASSIGQSHLSNIERGALSTSIPTLGRIAAALRVPASFFFLSAAEAAEYAETIELLLQLPNEGLREIVAEAVRSVERSKGSSTP